MSNGTVPQFPGKGGQQTKPAGPGPTQAAPAYSKVMCPFLTAGEIARHKEELIVTPGVQPAPPKAQSCKGPQCMLYVAAKLADGTEQGGCAPVMQIGQLNQLNFMVARFIAAAEAGAAAEAAAAEERARAAAGQPPLPPPGTPTTTPVPTADTTTTPTT